MGQTFELKQMVHCKEILNGSITGEAAELFFLDMLKKNRVCMQNNGAHDSAGASQRELLVLFYVTKKSPYSRSQKGLQDIRS